MQRLALLTSIVAAATGNPYKPVTCALVFQATGLDATDTATHRFFGAIAFSGGGEMQLCTGSGILEVPAGGASIFATAVYTMDDTGLGAVFACGTTDLDVHLGGTRFDYVAKLVSNRDTELLLFNLDANNEYALQYDEVICTFRLNSNGGMAYECQAQGSATAETWDMPLTGEAVQVSDYGQFREYAGKVLGPEDEAGVLTTGEGRSRRSVQTAMLSVERNARGLKMTDVLRANQMFVLDSPSGKTCQSSASDTVLSGGWLCVLVLLGIGVPA